MDEKDQIRDIKQAFKWIKDNFGEKHLITIQYFIYWQNTRIEDLTKSLEKSKIRISEHDKKNKSELEKLKQKHIKNIDKLKEKYRNI